MSYRKLNLQELYPQLSNESLMAATDGCFVAYHKEDSPSQFAIPYWSWPALEKQGIIADGVLVLIDGRAPIIVSPHGTANKYWSKTTLPVNRDVGNDISKAFADFTGKTRTEAIMAKGEELFGDEEDTWKDNYAAPWCNAYSHGAKGVGEWWLPSIGELIEIWKHKYAINKCLSIISGAQLITANAHWSSTEGAGTGAWILFLSSGDIYNWHYKNGYNNVYVRAVTAYNNATSLQYYTKEEIDSKLKNLLE